jgi:hypothetical protein
VAHFVFYDLPQEAKDQIAHLRWLMAGNRMMLALYRLEAVLRKANFNPNQPRVPAGNSDGGQWTGSGSSDDSPPHIPARAPSSGTARNKIIKTTVRFLVRAALIDTPGVGEVMLAIDAAEWAAPYVRSYFDNPKSLEELQQAASSPKTGYEIHHIAEQDAAEKDGFPRSLIDSSENVVRIPTLKHWEITGWFMTPNEDFGGTSPRAYLRGKTWAERVRVGQDALVKFGVLKP